MDRNDPKQPQAAPIKIDNWADYVDALSRHPGRSVVTHEKIKGRRLRDQFLNEVLVIREEPPII